MTDEPAVLEVTGVLNLDFEIHAWASMATGCVLADSWHTPPTRGTVRSRLWLSSIPTPALWRKTGSPISPVAAQTDFRANLFAKASRHGTRFYASHFCPNADSGCLVYMEHPDPVNTKARDLMGLFSRNVAIGFESVLPQKETEKL